MARGKYCEQEHRISLGPLNVAVGPDNGPPLILLHGVTRRWQCLLPVIEPLSSRWQVFAVDFPGHGKSSARCKTYSVVAYADAIHEWLEERFQEPLLLYGHSLGAMAAADLAGRLGEQVAAAILEDPPFHTMGERIAQTPLLSYFQGLQRFVGRDDPDLDQMVDELAGVTLTDPATGTVSRLGSTRSPAALRFMASCLVRLQPQVLQPIVQSEWLKDYSIEQVAGRLRCPVLLLQADAEQGGMLLDSEATILTDSGSNISRIHRDGIGHLMHWADPDWLAREVMLFLESLPIRHYGVA